MEKNGKYRPNPEARKTDHAGTTDLAVPTQNALLPWIHHRQQLTGASAHPPPGRFCRSPSVREEGQKSATPSLVPMQDSNLLRRSNSRDALFGRPLVYGPCGLLNPFRTVRGGWYRSRRHNHRYHAAFCSPQDGAGVELYWHDTRHDLPVVGLVDLHHWHNHNCIRDDPSAHGLAMLAQDSAHGPRTKDCWNGHGRTR